MDDPPEDGEEPTFELLNEEGFGLYLSGEDDGQFLEEYTIQSVDRLKTGFELVGDGTQYIWYALTVFMVGWMVFYRFRQL